MSLIDSRDFRNCCGRFATGVTIITTEIDGQKHGMTANGFMSVSLEPPTILVSIGKKTKTHALLEQSNSYGVSILAAEQKNLSNHFAGQHDETLTVPWEELDGNPVIGNTLAQFSARVIDAHEVGDHTLFIAEVTAMNYGDGQPILYYYTGYGELRE